MQSSFLVSRIVASQTSSILVVNLKYDKLYSNPDSHQYSHSVRVSTTADVALTDFSIIPQQYLGATMSHPVQNPSREAVC